MNTSKGLIYLIQPGELIGTERYKVGCSCKTDLSRCINGYRKGSRYIIIMECNEPFIIEYEIKKIFSNKFKLISGKEFFEGNEEDIKKEFLNIVSKLTIPILRKNFVCNICKILCSGQLEWNKHIITKKHIKNTGKQNTNNNEEYNSIPYIFNCKICAFVCKKKSNFDIHLKTIKHINRISMNKNEEKKIKNKFTCKNCLKEYNVRNSLWYHEKKCVSTLVIVNDNNITNDNDS